MEVRNRRILAAEPIMRTNRVDETSYAEVRPLYLALDKHDGVAYKRFNDDQANMLSYDRSRYDCHMSVKTDYKVILPNDVAAAHLQVQAWCRSRGNWAHAQLNPYRTGAATMHAY